MVYEWKQGSRFSVDATKVGREIEEIGNSVTAEAVVDKARRKKGELHSCFEWDDSVAAEEYRLNQAREILRSLVIAVVPSDPSEESIVIRAYEHVDLGEQSDPRRAYVPTKKALNNPELRKQVIARLYSSISEAKELAEKYEHLIVQFKEVKERLSKARDAVPV